MRMVTRAIVIGTFVGVLDGVGILFDPGEPYPYEILAAATLKGAIVGLMIESLAGSATSRIRMCAIGAAIGLALALDVFLAKGGFRSMDAPYVVPAGVLSGALTGLIISFTRPTRGSNLSRTPAPPEDAIHRS